MVHFHSDISYKHYKIFKYVIFYINFDVPFDSFHVNLIQKWKNY